MAGVAVRLGCSGWLAARGESPAAFGRRCIPKLPALSHFLQRSNTAGMLPRLALLGRRIATLSVTRDLHHRLLERFQERGESGIEERARASDPQACDDLRVGHAPFVQNQSGDQGRSIETHAAM